MRVALLPTATAKAINRMRNISTTMLTFDVVYAYAEVERLNEGEVKRKKTLTQYLLICNSQRKERLSHAFLLRASAPE